MQRRETSQTSFKRIGCDVNLSINDKALMAQDYFNHGWSLNVAMSKAGFLSTWRTTAIQYNPIVASIIIRNKQLNAEKNRQKAKGRII